jgi:quercetin dioxygenase-like cupin family protein
MGTSMAPGTLRPEYLERAIDAPFTSCDVPLEIARLRAERTYAVEGHCGRTLAKYADLRVVLEAMKAGERLPLHETAERMTLHVVLGRVLVRDRDGRGHELGEGTFAAIDAANAHEVECLHECAFVLTLAWPPRARGPADDDGSGI